MSTKASSHEKLALVEKVNSVFLGTRDFRALAERAVNLMTEELKDEGILSVSIFRVHPETRSLYAYAFSSRAFDAVSKLYPKKFSELNVSLDETSNLLVKAVLTKEEQEGTLLSDFAKPALNETISTAVQRLVGAKRGIAYPLRLPQGKVAGVILFSIGEEEFTEHQRTLLEVFRSQFELAFENVLEFERLLERYKRSIAKTEEMEERPSVHFMLRITPTQNAFLEKRAREEGLDKTSFIRFWVNWAMKEDPKRLRTPQRSIMDM